VSLADNVNYEHRHCIEAERQLREQCDKLAASLEEERGWKREFDMYRRAWIRELGGRLIPKTHEIDALVLTTQRLREDTQRETMQLCSKALRETVTRRDVVALIEKWCEK